MLAVDGGTPVRTTPFPKRALFGDQERAAAMALFDHAVESGNPIGYNGAEETAYEQEFASWHGGGTQALLFRRRRRWDGVGIFGNFRFGNFFQQAGNNSFCVETLSLGLEVGADSVPKYRLRDLANVVERH